MNKHFNLINHRKNLLKRIISWHSKSGDGFYKFLSPCKHPWYRNGDSWTEEMNLSDTTIRKYFKQICTAYSSKKAFLKMNDPFQGKIFSSYFDRLRKLTFYFKNKKIKVKKNLNQKILDQKTQTKLQKIIPGFGSKFVSIYNKKQNNKPPKSPLKTTKKNKDKQINQISWEIAQKMYNFWKQRTKESLSIPNLKINFAKKLIKTLKNHFSNSLELWKIYCKSIFSSDFLMGRNGKFKAWLIWIILEKTIEKIKQGGFGVKYLFSKKTYKISSQELINNIYNLQESKNLKKIRFIILQTIGIKSYISWFKFLIFEEINTLIIIKTPNKFISDQLTIKFGKIIKNLCLAFSKKYKIIVKNT